MRGRGIAGTCTGSGLLLLEIFETDTLLVLAALAAGEAVGHVPADGLEENIKLAVKILLLNPQIPAEQAKQLPLHLVDLCSAEREVGNDAATVIGDDGYICVPGPVLVLGRAVVQVLSGQNQSGQEDAMRSATAASGVRLQASLESGEVDQGRHQSGDLDVGTDYQASDELLEGWHRTLVRIRGLVLLGAIACNDLARLHGQVLDHGFGNSIVNKRLESGGVELLPAQLR